MSQKILVAKIWTKDMDGQKIPVRFLDSFHGNTNNSYIGLLFNIKDEKIILHFSYNSLYKMYRATLFNRIVKHK